MAIITGTPEADGATGTVHTVTVPAGVTSDYTALIIGSSADSAALTVTATTSGSGTFTQIVNQAANNTYITINKGTGFVAGDTITYTLSTGKGYQVRHEYESNVLSYGTPAIGTRGGVSQTFTTSGSVTPASGQTVKVIGVDRTLTAPTVSSVTSSGGETVTQSSWHHTASSVLPSTGVYIGSFVASANAARTATVTLSGASGNGLALVMLVTYNGPSSYSTDITEPIFAPTSWFDPILTPGGWYENSWAPPLYVPPASTKVDGTYYVSGTAGTSHVVTVPTGVTAAHRLLLMIGTSDGVAVTFTASTSAGGKFSKMHEGTAQNTAVGVFTGYGFVDGDTITITLSASKYVDIGHWYEKDVVYGYVTAATRGGVSQAFTTSAPARPLNTQRVVVLGLDRTSGPPTVSSVTSSGGETVTQRTFDHDSTGIQNVGMYHGEFTASSQDLRTSTVTLSAASTNGFAALVPVFDSTHTAVDQWMNRALRYSAHRGGSADWVEMTEFAYNQASLYNPTMALEVSVWKTSDGVWVASHDQTTLRMFGINTDIPSNTWATISGYTTTTGGYPIAKLTDILDQHQGRVFLVDNKQNTNVTAFLDLLDAYGGKNFFVSKGFITSSGTADAALLRGYTTWGYLYDADVAVNLPAKAASWTILAMDYAATAPNWAAVLAYGKPTDAHIIDSTAAAVTAVSYGIDGLQVSKVTSVVPQNTALSLSLAAPTATLSFTGAIARARGLALTAALGFTGAVSKTTSRTLRSFLTSQNLLPGDSASFEGNSLGLWTGAFAGTPATLSVSTVRSSYGERSMLVTWPTATALATEAFAPTSFFARRGHTYKMTARVWVPSGSPAVQAQIYPVGTGTASSTNDAWENITFTGTFNSADTLIGAKVVPASNTTSGQQVYVDHVRVEDVTGGLTKLTLRSVGGSLGFTGSVVKSTARALAASLSFVGSFFKLTTRPLAAALSFVGGLTTSFIGGGPITKALSASLSFTGSHTKQAGKSLAASLGFTGSQTKSIVHNQSAVLSFTGAVAKRTSRGLGASLGFTGSIAKRTARSLGAGLSFTGATSRQMARSLLAGLSFVGSQSKLTARSIGGGLTFTGSVAKRTARSLSAGLSFTGSVSKTAGKNLSAGLSFVGSQTKVIARPFNATLSFLGSFGSVLNGGGTAYTQNLTASLSFVGSQAKRTSRSLAASLGFTGSVAKLFPKSLTAALSFTGSITKRTGKTLSGGLSFVGSQTKFISYPVSAALSFSGSITKRTARSLGAGLSFTGSISKQGGKNLVAGLSFVGSQTKQTFRSLGAGLSFVGGLLTQKNSGPQLYLQPLSAALSFTGNVSKRTARSLTAGLSYVGSITRGRFASFTASLGFTGAVSKRTSRAQSASLGFVGSQVKRTSRAVSGALSFAGGVTKQTRRSLSGAVSFVGATTAGRIFFRSFSASLTFAGGITKRTGKSLGSVLSFIPGFSYIANILNPPPVVEHPDVVITMMTGDAVVTMSLGSVDGTDHAGSLVVASTGTSVLVTSGSGDVQ